MKTFNLFVSSFSFFCIIHLWIFCLIHWLRRVSLSAPWKYTLCSFGDMRFIHHWRYWCLHFFLVQSILLCPFQSFHSFNGYFSVRCLSSCCHTSCQERRSCRGNEIKRLYLAWPWSYICCSNDRGNSLHLLIFSSWNMFLILGFKQVLLIHEWKQGKKNLSLEIRVLNNIHYSSFIGYYIFGCISPQKIVI